jgi:hypothetical protein
MATVATVTQVPWYYMWSQKYRFFHEMLQNEVKEPNLRLEPIHIDQSVFDKELYQIEGHAWMGCCIKIDLLIQRLKDNIGKKETPYILFTDVDLIVKPGIYDKLTPYLNGEIDSTMVFLNEGGGLNIGFILLKVCDEVIAFWEIVREMMIEKPGHDQGYVNTLIKEYTGTWSVFDTKVFVCNNEWDGKTPFLLLQPLTSGLGKEYDFAEKIFYSAQHMSIDPYMQYVPQDIIPFIYKFQEILIRSHQQAKKEVQADAV